MSESTIAVIYCRGGDKYAPMLAAQCGMLYGVRYDYTAYGKVYMLDGGLNPNWARYQKRARALRPPFALVPDYMKPDIIALNLYIQDVRPYVGRIGVCPKFRGATKHIPPECIICESVPSVYAGWIIPDSEIIANRDYHLLGGDPRAQKMEIERITRLGGRVISLDGNKLAHKAAHGQVFTGAKWVKHVGDTGTLARISAQNIMGYLATPAPP